MTTARAIVNGALRKLGVLGSGRDARAQDAADALEALKGLYRSLISSGAFGRLADIVPLVDYVAGENQRVFRQNDGCTSVTLPQLVAAYPSNPLPYNQERLSYPEGAMTNNRPPRDLSVVQIIDGFSGTNETFIYNGQEKAWQSIDDLDLDDQAPLAARDVNGLSALLAVQLGDEFGQQIGATTARQAAVFQSGLVHNYSAPRQAVVGSYM